MAPIIRTPRRLPGRPHRTLLAATAIALAGAGCGGSSHASTKATSARPVGVALLTPHPGAAQNGATFSRAQARSYTRRYLHALYGAGVGFSVRACAAAGPTFYRCPFHMGVPTGGKCSGATQVGYLHGRFAVGYSRACSSPGGAINRFHSRRRAS